MSRLVVADTSVFIDHLRGIQSATRLLKTAFGGSERVAASELSKVELRAGLRRVQQSDFNDLLTLVDWLPVPTEVLGLAGDLAGEFGRSYSGIDPVDYVVAATAKNLDAELWTRNVKHFPMFPDLQTPY